MPHKLQNLQMNAIAIKIGKTIRAKREKRGLSQESLAELSNLNRTYLGEIERGLAMPSIETLEKISMAFGEKLSELIAEYEIHGRPSITH